MAEKIEHIALETVAARVLSERENIPILFEWAKQNPERIDSLLRSFDELVAKTNNALSTTVPEHLVNLLQLQKALGGNRLPTQVEMEQEGPARFVAFVRGMKIMSDKMKRGETTKEKPSLRFHTRTNDPEALAIGTIFHGYEEMMSRHPEFGEIFADDKLVDALMELIEPESELFEAMAAKDKLDWIDGYPGFSEKFRKSLGLS
ncbi:MAG: hypothetical protein KBD05_01405 [Candidatus Pacebacteria bacterium]|nr:hypothetical protein [Candidatus Paceibacterota bacterium]